MKPDLVRGWSPAALLACLLALAPPVHAGWWSGLFADGEPLSVEVTDPYIELHTGAGRGYPIFQVEERGAHIDILKRKTDWFKVRTARGKEGWVYRGQLERTLTPGGERMHSAEATQKEFAFHRWEAGATGGDFEGADVMSISGGYSLTPKVSVEAAVSKIFARFSSGESASVSLNIHPFPEWRFSPFVALGTGLIRSNPDTTLVQESDRTDQLAHVGLGLRVYLARRFIFRVQYKNYVIFQSTDDNQEINEWKAGFAVFF